jgi:hypothetical protein
LTALGKLATNIQNASFSIFWEIERFKTWMSCLAVYYNRIRNLLWI